MDGWLSGDKAGWNVRLVAEGKGVGDDGELDGTFATDGDDGREEGCNSTTDVLVDGSSDGIIEVWQSVG